MVIGFGKAREFVPGVTVGEVSVDSDRARAMNHGTPMLVDYSAVVADEEFHELQRREAVGMERAFRAARRRS